MAFDPTKVLGWVHSKWGARAVQLLVCGYLFYRYSRAWTDGKWSYFLTGNATQGEVWGFKIPYEIVTALTPAIVFGVEYWCVLEDRKNGKKLSPMGFILGVLVLLAANGYFWIAPRIASAGHGEPSNYVVEGADVTDGLAAVFSFGSLVAIVGMILVMRSYAAGSKLATPVVAADLEDG